MIKINITSKNLEAARKRAVFLGPNKKKIQGGSEIYGMVGEQLFLDNYGGALINNINYDIEHPKIGKIDIKTKKCNSEPLDHYYCTVAAYQIDKDDCEFYGFYRVDSKLRDAWFLGIISKEEFKKRATFLKKGDKDGDFTVKADCYNIRIDQLRAISEVMKDDQV